MEKLKSIYKKIQSNLMINNIAILLSFVIMGYSAFIENPALAIFGLGSLLFELLTHKKDDKQDIVIKNEE